MTTAKEPKKLHYLVSSDFHPWRWWSVTAESEIEARMIIADELNVDLSTTAAELSRLNTEETK